MVFTAELATFVAPGTKEVVAVENHCTVCPRRHWTSRNAQPLGVPVGVLGLAPPL
ncbi:MAG: hypothetical protein WC759_05725 [Candidatus Micrarchaeia archaeon]